MIIDCHTHIGQDHGKYWTPSELIHSMDEAGIDISLILSNFHGGEGTPIEKVLEACDEFPRLKAIGNVDYSTLDAEQIEKLKDLLLQKRIFGVKCYLGYEHFYPNDKKLYPLYEFCSQKSFPVIFHTGILEVGYKGLLKYSHPLGVDELATEFPNLKIVIAHLGNPWIADCAAVVVKNKNVYADFSGYFAEYQSISKEEKEEFVQRLIQFKLFVGDFKKCLFGTDWPLYSQKEYLDAVKSLPMSKEEKHLVFSENAQTLFRIL
jgi:predicted TIM-barrel fold metal-dependent hydrolase